MPACAGADGAGSRTVPATGYGEKGVRVWLDAAQAAVIGGHPEIAVQLLAGMPHAQRGHRSSNPLFLRRGRRPSDHESGRAAATRSPCAGWWSWARRSRATPASAMAHAAGRGVWRGGAEAARILLAAGADPARNGTPRRQPFGAGTGGDGRRCRVVARVAKAARPDTLQALMRHPDPLAGAAGPEAAGSRRAGHAAAVGGRRLRPEDAGRGCHPPGCEQQERGAGHLSDRCGRARPPAAAGGDGASQDHADEPLLPRRRDTAPGRHRRPPRWRAQTRPAWPRTGRALYWLIAQGNQAGLDRSLRGGARLDDPRLPPPARLTP